MRLPRPDRQEGYTLVETVLAIGIFSLILLGMMGIYTSVVRQKNLMVTAADVSVIRAAIVRRGCLGESDAIRWMDFADYLPHRLKAPAEENESATLGSANPWGSDYTLSRGGTGGPTWILQIGDTPDDLEEILGKQLMGHVSNVTLGATPCTTGNYCVGFDIEGCS